MKMDLKQALEKLGAENARAIEYFIAENQWPDIPKGYTALSDSLAVVKLEVEQPIELADKLEFHRKAIDLHYVVVGTDQVHTKALSNCGKLHLAYKEAEDYGLYADKPEEVLKLEAGQGIYLGPETAHMALCGTGTVQKLVFKIKVNE